VSPCVTLRHRGRTFCQKRVSAQTLLSVSRAEASGLRRPSSDRGFPWEVRGKGGGVCVARYYDPATGQFLSLDPDVAQTDAPFNYSGDDPVNEVDPNGLSGQETVPNPCWTEGPDRPPCCSPASQNPGGTGWLRWVAIGITIVATLPLDETGVGEGLDATVIATETATDVAAQTTADVAADTADTESGGGTLSNFGNASGPKAGRLSDFGISSSDETIGPYSPTAPTDDIPGTSTFRDPATSGLTGHYWNIPANTDLPDGLGFHEDGADVGGNAPVGHVTIYPTSGMNFAEFQNLVQGLPWEYGGKI
jgi:hypothetical protein